MQLKGEVSHRDFIMMGDDEMSSRISYASKALVCLMVSSKLQNSDIFMVAQNVRLIVQGFVNDAHEQIKIRSQTENIYPS